MKRIITLFCLLATANFVFAQCTPDTSITHNDPGIYPDSLTGLPHGTLNQPYSEVIQLKVRPDTNIIISGIPFHAIIDSVVITSVTGLPNGFSYACFPNSCSFPGGSNACITLSSPNASTPGQFPIVVHTFAYGTLAGTPTNVPDDNDDYMIVVDTTTGIGAIERISFSVGQNTPNPANAYASVPVIMNHSDDVTVTLSNLIGKKISTKVYSLQKGKSNITIDVHGLQPGIYLYSITDGKNTMTKRMIVSND